MSISLFADKNQRPDDAALDEALDSVLPAWQALIHFLRENYAPQEDFKFLYGKKYGWALRFRIGGRLLTSLYPGQNRFTVQINLSPEAVTRVQQTEPAAQVRQAIAQANPYPEGRWLFIPVRSEAELQAIYDLLALRIETAHLQLKL